MADKKEELPLDTLLLSEAIIELNISRHNVSIYPKDHPLVEKSLNRAFDFFQKLFELRTEITLAVAKDTLIIDDYFLDRKNAVYREFALSLSKINIAYVTFISGLTKDELYTFHRHILENVQHSSAEPLQEVVKGHNLIHIKIGFIDYGAFSLNEGKTGKRTKEGHLWERYVYGLLEGSLKTPDVSDVIHEIHPEVLAGLLNKTVTDKLKEETYDRVITTYLRKSSERSFSGKDLKKLLDFINGLRPELKKQFLSSALRTTFKDIDKAEKALMEMSVDEVIGLLNTINEQKVAIPDAFKNLLDKLSKLNLDGMKVLTFREGLIVDDVFLPPDVMSLLDKGEFKTFVSDTYQKEIQSILKFDASDVNVEATKEFERECSDECLERDFNHTMLELISSDIPNIIPQKEYEYFINVIKEQTEQFIGTGQYGQVLKTFRVLESNTIENKLPDIASEVLQHYNSPEFISLLIDSFRIVGRQMRDDVLLLCEYYGERIIPPLMDALIKEGSQTIRRFLISLITHMGDKAIPEAIKHLGDSRWFVKRNMLFILSECGSEDTLPYVRRYSRHKNPKVSFQAIKCLLKAKDSYGIEVLKDCLRAKSRDVVEQAIVLSGAFRVSNVVPDLINMLREKAISGVDFYNKIPIVKALGQIGDPRALDTLRNIISAKSIFFKGALEKLKEEIYRTLKNYPYEDVKDLIEAGVKSKKYVDSR